MVDPAQVPAGHSLLDMESLLEVVARDYALSMPVRGTLLRAWTNDVYEVVGGGQRYILKVYRASWRSPDDVVWEVALQEHLAQQTAITSPVIPRRDGRLSGTLHAPEGIRPFALFRH